jgi:hypothetical protein
MAAIGVYLDGEGCWPEIDQRPRIDLRDRGAPPIQLALNPSGTKDGDASLTVRIDLPDGVVLLSRVSLKHFLEAAKALQSADAAYRKRMP